MIATPVPLAYPVPVIDPASMPKDRWQDANGRWYRMGQVIETGDIVGKPGELIRAGIVWIGCEELEAAEKHGWVKSERTSAPFGLVAVERR